MYADALKRALESKNYGELNGCDEDAREAMKTTMKEDYEEINFSRMTKDLNANVDKFKSQVKIWNRYLRSRGTIFTHHITYRNIIVYTN